MALLVRDNRESACGGFDVSLVHGFSQSHLGRGSWIARLWEAARAGGRFLSLSRLSAVRDRISGVVSEFREVPSCCML